MLVTFWNNLLVRSASMTLLKCFLSRQLTRFWNRAVPLHMNKNTFVCMGFQTIQSFFLSTTISLFLFQAISFLVSFSSCKCSMNLILEAFYLGSSHLILIFFIVISVSLSLSFSSVFSKPLFLSGTDLTCRSLV